SKTLAQILPIFSEFASMGISYICITVRLGAAAGVDWQVLDARLLNWLRVELHQSQYLLRHTHFDGEPQRAGFSCSKRVVMRPMSTRKLIREGFRSRWIHPRRQ